jgi:hypothetical protein
LPGDVAKECSLFKIAKIRVAGIGNFLMVHARIIGSVGPMNKTEKMNRASYVATKILKGATSRPNSRLASCPLLQQRRAGEDAGARGKKRIIPMSLKPFKMSIYCQKCGCFVKEEPSWKPGVSFGGLCNDCLQASLRSTRFIQAFMFWRGGRGLWWLFPLLLGLAALAGMVARLWGG